MVLYQNLKSAQAQRVEQVEQVVGARLPNSAQIIFPNFAISKHLQPTQPTISGRENFCRFRIVFRRRDVFDDAVLRDADPAGHRQQGRGGVAQVVRTRSSYPRQNNFKLVRQGEPLQPVNEARRRRRGS